MGQKSAEVVVDKDVTTHGGVVAGNEPGSGRDGLTRRRTELEEGDVILHELPQHIQNPTGWVPERVMGIQLPRIVAVTAVLSKNCDYLRPAMARHSLGTAVCGPACTVVWRPGERNPRLSDWRHSFSGQGC